MDSVFFDLDGTLTDPKVGIVGCIQYALNELGRPSQPDENLLWCIGPPLQGSFQTLLGSEAAAVAALALYRRRFSDIGLYENELYPGIAAALASLRQSGLKLYVATSKPAVYAERIVAHFHIGTYFERVFGSELDGTRTDKAELLTYAIGETGIDPARAIMIGDRRHDVIGARANAMTAIGVLYGYGSKDELEAAGAHHLCASPHDIVPAVMAQRR